MRTDWTYDSQEVFIDYKDFYAELNVQFRYYEDEEVNYKRVEVVGYSVICADDDFPFDGIDNSYLISKLF